MIEFMLEVLRKYKVLCDYNGTDFDADKTVQYSSLIKTKTKNFEGFRPIELRMAMFQKKKECNMKEALRLKEKFGEN